MRNTFIKKISQYAKKNKNVYLLTADLGFRSFEPFQKEFPDRFINVGVAENNLVGLAAGMALSGKKVYVYSILPFLVFKSYEQIRNLICHNSLDVTLVGGGGGFSYAEQGISHNTTEDISILRALPNLTLFNPGTKIETENAMHFSYTTGGPSMLRLGKAPLLEIESIDNRLNKKNYLRPNLIIKGKKITIFTTGNILENVIKSAEILKVKGVNFSLYSVNCIKPVDVNYIKRIMKTKLLVTVEEGSEIGGLGSLISDLISLNKNKYSLKKIALTDKVHSEIGSQEYLRDINKLSPNKIASSIIKFYKSYGN